MIKYGASNRSLLLSESSGDSFNCQIKLFAVSDSRQKLIGSISFFVDWRDDSFKPLNMHAMPFTKCIEKGAILVLSTKLEDQFRTSKC